MHNILKIEDAVQGYVSITVSLPEGNRKYTVRVSAYEEIGMPCRGTELDSEAMELLSRADEYYRAKRAALSILSYGDNNERTLHTKLRARSISDEVAAEVVREMVSLGYIDESRQLRRLITEDANRKLLGPRKIIPRLMAKGYSLSDVKAEFLLLTDSGEIDIDKNKELLLEKYLGDDRDPERMKKLLYKYGYDF